MLSTIPALASHLEPTIHEHTTPQIDSVLLLVHIVDSFIHGFVLRWSDEVDTLAADDHILQLTGNSTYPGGLVWAGWTHIPRPTDVHYYQLRAASSSRPNTLSDGWMDWRSTVHGSMNFMSI